MPVATRVSAPRGIDVASWLFSAALQVSSSTPSLPCAAARPQNRAALPEERPRPSTSAMELAISRFCGDATPIPRTWSAQASAGQARADAERFHGSRLRFPCDLMTASPIAPAISTTFWSTIYFYTASATAGNLSCDCARGRHRTVSATASRRHVDPSLCSFTRKKPT